MPPPPPCSALAALAPFPPSHPRTVLCGAQRLLPRLPILQQVYRGVVAMVPELAGGRATVPALAGGRGQGASGDVPAVGSRQAGAAAAGDFGPGRPAAAAAAAGSRQAPGSRLADSDLDPDLGADPTSAAQQGEDGRTDGGGGGAARSRGKGRRRRKGAPAGAATPAV